MKISTRVSTVGLVGLVAITTVLVGLALKSNDATAVGSPTAPLASASAAVSPSPTPSLSPTPTALLTPAPTPTPTPTVAAATPVQTMLVALDNQRAWRITTGSCAGGGAKVSTTTDGGTTWADGNSPLRTIVRVRPVGTRSAFVVGADSACAAELKNTGDGGNTWTSGSAVGSAWYRDPKSPSAVSAPGSATSHPCGQRLVLDLAVISNGGARVLCADGLVLSTTNAGSSWTESGKVIGAVALAVSLASPSQTYVALLHASGCAGVQVRQVGQSAPTSCISTTLPKSSGQVALSLVAGGGWLSVGDTTMRSTDSLATWSTS